MDWSPNFTSTAATLVPGGTRDTCINLLMRALDYTSPAVDGECKLGLWTMDWTMEWTMDHFRAVFFRR